MRDLIQLAVKTETVPGTAIALTSADVLTHLRDGDSPDIGIDFQDTGEVQAYSSSRPGRPGLLKFGANISWVLRPSLTPASIAPYCNRLLGAGMLLEQVVKSIAIGSITTGPFVDGELITQATSGATGRVFRNCSATPLRYVPVSGTMTSGYLITGGTSTATATSSAGPAAAGFLYTLTDSDFTGGSDSKHHVTAEFLRGGYAWKGQGCLGELSFEFRNMNFVTCRQKLMGSLVSHVDQALYAITGYPDDGIAEPRFTSAALLIGGYSPTDIIDFNLDLPLGLEVREDAQTATGIYYTDYDRKGSPPKVTFEPAMVSAATFDFFTKLTAGTTFAMSWKLGTTFDFFADECQFESVGTGKRRSMCTAPLVIRLCGTRNNDLQIWAHAAP